jgi:manganese/zinc/iron transport system permease protein
VIGVQRYAANIHLDLDSTIYGEIAFAPFRTLDLFGVEIARSVLTMALVAAANLVLVVLLWKEFKITSFDPEFARTTGFGPTLLARLLLVAGLDHGRDGVRVRRRHPRRGHADRPRRGRPTCSPTGWC